VVLGIGFGEEPKAVRGFLSHNPSTVETLPDPQRTVSMAYQVDSIPTIILVGRDGKVAYYSTEEGDLEKDLREALKKEGIAE